MWETRGPNARDINFDRTIPNQGWTMEDFEPESNGHTPEILTPRQEILIRHLFRSGCIKFGEFYLTSGKESPYILDLAHAQHNPSLSTMILDEYLQKINSSYRPDLISGIPSASIPTATLVAHKLGIGMITVRIKELDKDQEMVIDGLTQFSQGKEALLVDDAGTTGGSIKKAAEALRQKGVVVKRAIVLLDRQEGAFENLAEERITLISIFKAGDFFEYARSTRDVLEEQNYEKFREYFEQNRTGR